MIIRDGLGWIVVAIGLIALIVGIAGIFMFSGNARFIGLGAGVVIFLATGAITYLRRD